MKYLHKKGMSPKEIHEDMKTTLRLKDAATEIQVEAVHRMVMNDRRVTIQHVASTIISFGSVQLIVSDVLHMNKLSARWVPIMLTQDQKLTRLNISRELLTRFQQHPENFLRRIVTQDPTWVHHFDPESKAQSKQWKHHGSPPPKTFKQVCVISRQGDGISILGLQGCNHGGLSS